MFRKMMMFTVVMTTTLLTAAQARTFIVNNTADVIDRAPGNGICGGLIPGTKTIVCSLRAAVMEANASAGTDTIVVRPATYSLVLTGTDDSGRVGDLDINEAVQITGSGPSVIIDSSLLGDRIFHVTGAYNVSFENLTLQGDPYAKVLLNGNGIYSNNGVLDLDTVVFQNFYSTSGGGMYLNGGSAHLSGPVSFLSNRTSTYGAGLYASSATVTSDSAGIATFTGNTAANQGGAIYAGVGTVIELAGSMFTSNVSTTKSGGAIYNAGSFLLDNSSFELNHAYTDGGAIANVTTGTLEVLASTFTDNSSLDGGAIHTSATVPAIVDLSVFESNVAEIAGNGDGGAIAVEIGRLSIDRSTFSHNRSNLRGGAIACDSAVELTILNSLFSGNRTQEGGAVSVVECDSAPVSNSTFTGNSGTYGGAFYVNDADLTLNSATVTDNAAYYDGGSIFTRGSASSTQTLRNTILAGNTAGRNGQDCFTYYSYGLTSSDYNLIGSGDHCTVSASGAHDQVGTDAVPVDPLLDVLADNGGDSDTHALLVGSPAIDAGNPAGCTDGMSALSYDQRGSAYPRIAGAACDIGAFEL